ncbi:SDR family oxidoreductase [Cryobacterium tagatosivorans]|uniref:SDR family oxidoreductase n=2 Tax=Cryobacterium tagatosivorans TaxID=1259199 RepID=A0A4R8UJP4_9MICO|nr:SDR family oxidoreductase [Cryobacterium tagatosivorans]TFB55972.1 SDR family oxidoreductase [Cryobacterium tagatosivorans]
MNVDLQSATALVTGASRGIGRAIALDLSRSGARVIGLQRSDDVHSHIARSVAVDLSDPEAIESRMEELLRDEEIDILVNNAGMVIRHPFEKYPLRDWDDVLNVNLRAVAQVTQQVGRQMLTRGSGRIVNIASANSFVGGTNVAAYSASKGAIAQFTKALANEWGNRGVTVNAVAPGYIATELNKALLNDEARRRSILDRIPAGRWGDADDIAGTVTFLCSAAAHYINGAIIPVDGGYLVR